MTASANLSGRFIKDNNSNGTANGATSIDGALPENAVATFHPNSSASFEWSTDEQSILEDLLSKYSSDTIIVRYAKIAQQLNDKTVRDVALRCKWMTKKGYGKRGKDDQNSLRKNKDKKEKVTASVPRSSQFANRSNGFPHTQPVLSIDNDDGISYKDLYQWYRSKHHVSRLQSSGKDGDAGIAVFVQDWQCSSRTSHRLVQSQSDVGAGMAECGGLLWFTLQDIGGATGQLLEQNAQAFDQISANFAALKIHENINLFCQTRNNILTMLNEIEAKKAALPKQMPPFPVKLNEELADSILRQTSMLMPMPNQS